jgi:hypothetical protein
MQFNHECTRMDTNGNGATLFPPSSPAISQLCFRSGLVQNFSDEFVFIRVH